MSARFLTDLESEDDGVVYNSLLQFARQTKGSDNEFVIQNINAFENIYQLFDKHDGRYKAIILSILANCANFNLSWRKKFVDHNGLKQIEIILTECTDFDILSRTGRLIANIAKDDSYLQTLQTKFIISALVKYTCLENVKCQMSFLRALRIICCTSKCVKIATEHDLFSRVLTLMESAETEVAILCLRMIREMAKTRAIELCYRLIGGDMLNKVLQLHRDGSNQVKEMCLEILFLLSLQSVCRVTVANEGAIEIFLSKIKCLQDCDSFKYATQGLCLCAREALNRNKMKSAGVLSALVNILLREELVAYHESIVAAFVWFLFDDPSLGILIRAGVVPALLKYLDRLTYVEFSRGSEVLKNEATTSDVDDIVEPMEDEKKIVASPSKETFDTSNYASNEQWLLSSPETSPYNANSPQYSIPSFSPHKSPSYSPRMSPEYSPHVSPNYSPQMSPRYSPNRSPYYPALLSYPAMEYDAYSDASVESTSSIWKVLPYHFQSADGIHAMIHGTRGPIHDILLLLSRFSQAKDPSGFFLALPGFNSLLDYLLLTYKPNPKCARVLNRLTSNSHCFDIMIRKRLIPRLHLRLCTGYSLEYLTEQFESERRKFENPTTVESASEIKCDENGADGMKTDVQRPTNTVSKDSRKPSEHFCGDVGEGDSANNPENKKSAINPENNESSVTMLCKNPSPSSLSLGHLLLSNVKSHSESSYGKGVLSHILLTGSENLKETCLFSLPYIMWSPHSKLQKRMIQDLKAMDMLMKMVSSSLTMDSESFVLTVEAVCALSKLLLADNSSSFDTDPDFGVCPPKRQKMNSDEMKKHLVGEHTMFRLPSGRIVKCQSACLSFHSAVFARMISRDYVDSEKDFISLTVPHEDAFVKMIHYMHGCAIHFASHDCHYCELDSVCDQSVSNLMTPEDENAVIDCLTKFSPERGKRKWREKDTEPRNQNTTSEVSVLQLLICCERFFVDKLKQNCEMFLINTINEGNVVEYIMFSFKHNSRALLRHSLIYLLTSVKCPLDRISCFAELLYSHLKDEFLSSLSDILQNGYERAAC